MTVAERIRQKLTDGLAPAALDIVDDSHRHVGHAGHDGRGESHFRVRVVAAAFEGRSRVDRQRLVYGLLAEEMRDRVHALALTTLTPDEAEAAAAG
ncbi:MAG: BolA family protein [Azospirillaceae bacterium]